jgi:hypothetical protein
MLHNVIVAPSAAIVKVSLTLGASLWPDYAPGRTERRAGARPFHDHFET